MKVKFTLLFIILSLNITAKQHEALDTTGTLTNFLTQSTNYAGEGKPHCNCPANNPNENKTPNASSKRNTNGASVIEI